MRKRREHELGVRERRVVVSDEPHVPAPEACLFTATFVGRCERELEPRVPSDESAEFATRVAARAEYSNRDSMHDECILLQHADVNRDAAVSPPEGLA
jgi:hypothetical protein